ncbi:unnamed protein product, partial [Ectocarpus sp. 13 AM-2016]
VLPHVSSGVHHRLQQDQGLAGGCARDSGDGGHADRGRESEAHRGRSFLHPPQETHGTGPAQGAVRGRATRQEGERKGAQSGQQAQG